MKEPKNLVAIAYCAAADTLNFSESEWDLLVRQARSANMLARLCARFEESQLLDKIPQQVKFHFTSAKIAAQALKRSIRWEVHCICNALENTEIPVALLKGAAYAVGRLSAGIGRQFEDVDILVPKEELDTVERKLMLHGWVTTHIDSYDQRYYRQWMHELPPMRHVDRQSSLDVHHTILPETARLHPNPKKLFARAVLIDNDKPLYILSKPDIVLHSATHLFSDGELHNGFRDLTDLDLLLRDFGEKEQFWSELLSRAQEMELSKPLFYALRYTSRILGTPVPKEIMTQSEAQRPKGLSMLLMDYLFEHGLQPDHPTCRKPLNGLARWMLYVRSHYLRMPLQLLIPHLVRKAVKKDKH
jgi:hypothetical protein